MLAELFSLLDTTTLLLFVFLLGLSWWLISVRGPGLPPGPFPVPLLGNLLGIGREMDNVLMKWNRKYGDVFNLYLGSKRAVVVCGFEGIKELLTRRGDDFIDRPFMYQADKATKGSKGVIMSNGIRWKESRRFALMTMRDFGVGKHTLWERTVEEAVDLCQRLDRTEEKIMNMKPHLLSSVSNVIASVIFGRRFEYGDPEFVEVSEAIDDIVRNNAAKSIVDLIPWLRFLPFLNTIESNFAVIEKFVQSKFDEHRSSYDPSQPVRDFVDLYLQVEQGLSDFDKDIFDQDQMYMLIIDLFVGGMETTSTTLLWGILYLSLNEDIQKRFRDEIHAVLGPNGLPESEHRSEMPFVEATLLEIQRVGDIAPFTVRAASKDTSLNGYHVPKGTMIMLLFRSIHHNPASYPEPDEFRPQRWLDDDGKLSRQEDFIPFSLGRRNCLGENLAKMELFIFFVILMQRFSFSIPQGHPAPSTAGIIGSTRSPHEYKVLVTKVE